MCIAQLELRFILSQGIMCDIVHECLGYRKVCSRWVSRNLTDEHKRHTWDHPWFFFNVTNSMVKHSYAELLQKMRFESLTTLQRARLHRWPVSITLQSKRSPRQRNLQEKWWPLLMGCLWSSVGWFHTSRFSSCLSGNSKEGLLFFSMKDLTIDISLWYVFKQTWWVCEK